MTNPNTSLATIKEKVAALAAPDATLADIGNNLGYLWDQAAKNNDDIAKEYLSAAWERTQALAVNTSAANAVATAALETAVEIAEQHADLIRAIDNMDYTNPHIAELIEAVEESTYEWPSYNDEFTEGIHDLSLIHI